MRCPIFLSLLLLLPLLGLVQAQDVSEEEVAEPSPIDNLTLDQCDKKRRGCCSDLYLGDEETLMKCFSIHSDRLPAEGDTDMSKSLKFLSCFVECLYKQRKYVGKSDTINMKMVKLDAEILYADRPKEQAYHIKMFDYCRKDAMKLYNLLKASPGAKAMLKNACRPFLLMVYLCQSEYHKKHECPYFRWEGREKSNTKKPCHDAKVKCYELDGIPAPAEH
ncbi:PREDICTED: uncharacterized protein LOC108614897 [Drosophila arizonae]|uniref:Uncharacterized protein LOC108614897 n=1 Tax=Drosophila arizonae TaxID=7263 RepID=A0ABM1PBL8_DROAR|nr:PREDICTED: uncharacterized protein LOC108614897 [Drosophila arizonae]